MSIDHCGHDALGAFANYSKYLSGRISFLHTSDVRWSGYLVDFQWLFHRFVWTIVPHELEVSWFSHKMHSQTDGEASVFQFQSTDLRGHRDARDGPIDRRALRDILIDELRITYIWSQCLRIQDGLILVLKTGYDMELLESVWAIPRDNSESTETYLTVTGISSQNLQYNPTTPRWTLKITTYMIVVDDGWARFYFLLGITPMDHFW